MVADFCAWVQREGAGHRNRDPDPWTVYAETAGWDLLLVRDADGFQIGVEAKLRLNVEVLCQTIGHDHTAYYRESSGPDCWAVLVPGAKCQAGLAALARRLGIMVIAGTGPPDFGFGRTAAPRFEPHLPHSNPRFGIWEGEDEFGHGHWVERCPDQRCELPEYVPDVTGGHSAPIRLTPWKIKAIKIAVLIETRGRVSRADFRHIKIDSRRWTDSWLRSDGNGAWVPDGMPDFKAQHPVNYEEIKADFAKWAPPVQPSGGRG